MSSKRTTHPPVGKEMRAVVAYLRDVDGCEFEPHGAQVKVYQRGAYVGTISGKGKANDVRAIRHSISGLQKRGLLATYGQEPPKKAAPPAAPAPTRAAAPPVAPPTPMQEVPDAPAVPAAPEAAAVVVAQPARPVRAHTAHQARLDDVRRRVFRALADLGGNTTEVRAEFVRFALTEGERAGLRLPMPGKLGGTASTAYDSLRNSFGKFLAGGGLSERNLDLFENAVQALERPRPQAQPVPAAMPVAAAGGTTRPVVEQVADEDGRLQLEVRGSGLPGSRPLYTSERPPGYTTPRDVEGRMLPDQPPPTDLPGPGGIRPVEGEPTPGEYPPPDPVAAAKAAATEAYLGQLVAKAAEGDADARDRLERYLGLG